MKTALTRAVEILGGQTALARAIDVKQPYIWNWLNRPAAEIPPEYCVAIEHATGGKVTRQELRPDDWQRIWPELAEPRKDTGYPIGRKKN